MKDLLTVFPNYVELWNQLDLEYRRTPSWRVIRTAALLRRMHNLTTQYERWFNDLMEAQK